ncbi:hypothetical protein GDO81_008535 [Engystomops pustulosus]|uniref:Cystatin domain-containing protein n=1 Tax=Engystomops pustulosus TaxID=76066 RepID=A0AAV7CGE7_ENGPU|nr:hypothetical protein GDO81_008535 [Engystomops pustulosus]
MAMIWKICLVLTLALCTQVSAQNKNLLGGWREAKEGDKGAMSALEFATEQYNNEGRNGYITEINKIIRMRKQVVAGMKYAIEVEVLVSPCPKGIVNTEECQNQNTKKQRCTFEVVIVPWQNIKEVLKSFCM